MQDIAEFNTVAGQAGESHLTQEGQADPASKVWKRWQSIPQTLRNVILVEALKGKPMRELIELYAPKDDNGHEDNHPLLPV